MTDEPGPAKPSPGVKEAPASALVTSPARAATRVAAAPPVVAAEQLPSMSLLEHLEELRKRLIWSALALVVAFFACWNYSQDIFHFLAKPIYRFLPKGQKLVILGVTDGFVLYIKVACLAAVFVASPVLLYHLWRFVQPGLYRKERRYAMSFIASGTILFLAGGAFAYYIAFPFAVQFLLSIGQDFTPSITGPSYLSFLMTVILGLGLMFELPVVMVFLSLIGLVPPRFYMRYFRHAIVLIFVAAAIITPTPDIFNMCLFAIPTLGLYVLGVGVAYLVTRAKRQQAAAGAAGDLDGGDGAVVAR